MMDELAKFRVVVSGETEPGFDKEEVLRNLADLFNSNPKKMGPLLSGKEVPLKKHYLGRDAEKICNKIRAAGAKCYHVEIEEPPIEIVKEDVLDQHSEEAGGHSLQLPQSELARLQEIPAAEEDDSVQDHRDAEEDLARFIGPNAEYYIAQFGNFGVPEDPRFRISWHWPAFFFFFLWALYRKLWAWAIFYIAAGTAMMLVVSPGLFHLLWMLVWPLCANYIYFRKVAAATIAAREHPDMEDRIYATGGVSRLAVWIGTTAVLVSFLLSINSMTARFMEEYGDEIRGVGPGSGTQLRRDGTAFVAPGDGQSELAKTSLVLSTLAVYLKVLLSANQDGGGSTAISGFLEKLENENVTDSWGNRIHVEERVDSYMLISAGPDGILGNDDDILQPVSIN